MLQEVTTAAGVRARHPQCADGARLEEALERTGVVVRTALLWRASRQDFVMWCGTRSAPAGELEVETGRPGTRPRESARAFATTCGRLSSRVRALVVACASAGKGRLPERASRTSLRVGASSR